MSDGFAGQVALIEHIIADPKRDSYAKRCLDVAVAGTLLLGLAPLLVFLALLVRLETSGPALFVQERIGRGGKPFRIFKLRTMVHREETVIRSATYGDDRITKVGRFLRRTSLDEIPQLLNVLRGEMSLVGPRPHARGHDEAFSKTVPDYAARFRMRPGLTGLAQVSGFRGEIREHSCILNRVAADNRYIDTWSFWLDIKIILLTVPHLIFTRQAY
jgi:putative colanic acid biosynthesis UDP-glucose lipid carrier transferase